VAPPVARGPSVMLVAGEASGDAHGAALCRSLRMQASGVRLFGMGGARMRAAGVDLLADVSAVAAVGASEAVSRLPVLYRTFRRLRRAIVEETPSVLVLIDFPEFNLRLARVAAGAGVPVVYFIPPQIWAWRGGRVNLIRRVVTLVLAVFPFELPLYRRGGVPVEFVGHPLLDAIPAAPGRAEARQHLGIAGERLVLGLLPGSRLEEVRRMLAVMREAVARVRTTHPDLRVLLARAPTIDPAVLAGALDGDARIDVVDGATYAVMRASDMLLVTSGTATLEAALLGTPMVVCYRVSRVTEIQARLLVRIPWMSLANIVLGRAVVPELYQGSLTGARLGAAALALLADAEAREAQREAFRELQQHLGEPGVAARAAGLVLRAAGVAA
jgi:lipid-A-disaccharide synthase